MLYLNTNDEIVREYFRRDEENPTAEAAAAPDSNDSGGEGNKSSVLTDNYQGFGAGDLPPIGVGKEGSGEGGVQ